MTYRDRVEVLTKALEEIEQFGHSHGHGRGYTCANIAEKALNESRTGSIRRRTTQTS